MIFRFHRDFLRLGTSVMEGSGKMLILAVGEHSQAGMIFKLLGATKESEDEKKSKKKSLFRIETNDRAFSHYSLLFCLEIEKGNKNDDNLAEKKEDHAANGKNHEATELQALTTDGETAQNPENNEKETKSKITERSILQAKLTKLAIHIGYVGMSTVFTSQDKFRERQIFILSAFQIGMTIAVLTVLVLFARFAIEEFIQK